MNHRAMVRAGREPISTPGMPDEGDAADGRNAQIVLKNSNFLIDHNSQGHTQASTKITWGPS